MTDEHDRAALQSVAAGDKDALRRLYVRHYSGLFQFVRTRLKDPAETADVIQDTFLAVWRQAEGFRAGSSVKTWIYGIARYKAIDRGRRFRDETDIDEIPEIADPSPHPEQLALAASDARRVRACIDGLTPAHQRVIRLAYYEDADYQEIADIEAIPVGTVKTRIFHAKKLLMRCLGGKAADG
jgi:RNA polymerase sigma-70 factor, ECF subfamily